jgi:hypothetical protein
MRFILLFVCCVFGFSASAQWYRINLKKHIRFPLIAEVADHSIARLPHTAIGVQKIQILRLDRSDYNLEAAERQVTKTAQHNMRFRVYSEASYNFNELAGLYLQQNRLTEAKWFLLQSNNISRADNNDKLTIANLMGLATIKAELGDFTQAQQDLAEAHEMAMSRGYRDDMLRIEKKISDLKRKQLLPKPELRYAETPAATTKAG